VYPLWEKTDLNKSKISSIIKVERKENTREEERNIMGHNKKENIFQCFTLVHSAWSREFIY
jgi:hypothetical protein